jgi:hypothetical protein
MNAIEDRLRAATRAAARTVPADSAPPLRLPSRRGGLFGLPGRWLPRTWPHVLVPVAAAAAVVGLVAASLAIADAMPGGHRGTGGHPVRPASGVTSSPTSAPSRLATPAPAQSSLLSTAAPPSGALTATITGLSATPVLRYGGPPVEFGVYVGNGTARTYSDITFALSLAHCYTCSTSPAKPAPSGTMQEEDSATGQWQSIFYDTEGTGMDWLQVTMPGFSLSPGASVSFTFRIAFDPLSQQPENFGPGLTAIDVTLEALPSHTVIGTMPGESFPLRAATS